MGPASTDYRQAPFFNIAVIALVHFLLASQSIAEKCDGDTYYIRFAPSSISSPNYNTIGQYEPNDRCYWSIEAPLNYVIRLDFLDFDLPSSSSVCGDDNVTIFDNSYGALEPTTPVPRQPARSRKQPVTFCGSRLPPTYTSTFNQVFIAFASDGSPNGRGFNVHFDFIDSNFIRTRNFSSDSEFEASGTTTPKKPERCQSRRVSLSGREGCIQTPNYGFGSYADRDTCFWLITSEPGSYMKLRFETFALASSQGQCSIDSDRLELYSGSNENTPLLAGFCGSNIPPPVDTISNVLFAKFVSSGTRQLSGFKMCWQSAALDSCNSSLTAIVDSSAFSASSYFSEQVPALAKFPKCCWSSRSPTEPGAFLQINFRSGRLYQVNKIAIRGNPMTNEWVTRFALSYQSGDSDPTKWFEYHDASGFRKTFTGNNDPNLVVYVNIQPPISGAKAIRILPLAANQWMSLTVDVFGCEDTVTYPRYSLKQGNLLDSVPAQRCNGDSQTLTAPSGFISTPGFPHPYSNNDVCSWRITAPPNSRIRLSSENFKIEESYLCANDRLAVYDGSSIVAPALGVYCGTNGPPYLISTGPDMFVKFSSDGTVQSDGFRLHYDFVHRWEAGNVVEDGPNALNDFLPNNNEIGLGGASSTERCNGETRILTALGGYVRSPRYGVADYPNTDLCYWQVIGSKNTRIRLLFENFDVSQTSFDCSQSGDVLSVFDGPDEASPLIGTFCGKRVIDPIVMTKNTVFLKFKSDSRISAAGFSVRYELIDSQSAVISVPQSPIGTLNGSRCGGRRLFMYDNNGLIFSPGFEAGAYGLNDECYWTIAAATPSQRVRLAFRSFNVGAPSGGTCPNDRVEIYDGPNEQATRVALLCGSRAEYVPGPITSSSRYLAIKFQSRDITTRAKGFAAFYAFIPGTGDFVTTRRPEITTTPEPPSDNEPTTEGKCDGRYFVLQLNRGQVERIGTSTIAEADSCNWLISSPVDTKLQISIVDMMLHGSSQCFADALTVYDGATTVDRRLLRICGSYLPDTVVTSGPKVLIRFITSTTRPEAYFHAIVKVLGEGDRPDEPVNPIDQLDFTTRRQPVIDTTTISPYDRQPAQTTPSACQRSNPCPPNYRCVLHQGLGFCIPGSPYVPVDAETAAQLAGNSFVDPQVYWDISRTQQLLAVLVSSTTPRPRDLPSGQVADLVPSEVLPSITQKPQTTRARRTRPRTTVTEPAPTEPPTTPRPPPRPRTTPTTPQPIATESSLMATKCGGQSFVFVSTLQGSITSAGYERGLAYPSQDSCFWQIEAPLGFSGVRLTLMDFDLAWSTDCTGDHLQIYDDHDSPTNSPDTLIATLCGTPRKTDPKAVFTTTGRRVAIAFYSLSPGSQTHRGFNIAFTAVRNT